LQGPQKKDMERDLAGDEETINTWARGSIFSNYYERDTLV